MDESCQSNPTTHFGDGKEAKRIAIVGKTGAGKSSVGNTLLGIDHFKSNCAGESVTATMQWKVGELPNSKRLIKVVDTPGILDPKGHKDDIKQEIEKAIKALSPGPHAILIVISPGSFSDGDRKIISELKELFRSDGFLQFAIIVMVRKNEIKNDNGEPMDINTFIDMNCAQDVQFLYKACDQRIVAVENGAPALERNQYAQQIMAAVDGIGGGYFNLAYREVERLKICNIV